ncbi:MAG: hypothetical protein IT169_18220 [Bryobacterales bacterium]|nr:hypothetical protein [Bryobacterales bacterium]
MLRIKMRRVNGDPRTLAVIPGAYNPPTIAHAALAIRAAEMADEVLLLLPEILPHKDFDGAGFETRLDLLRRAVDHNRVSVGASTGGLFLEVARACAARFPNAEISLVCGRDAAERILAWPYPEEGALERLFSLVKLWVFDRHGALHVPEMLRESIVLFPSEEHLQRLSSTEVRRRIAGGEEWRELVPPSIRDDVEHIYTRTQGRGTESREAAFRAHEFIRAADHLAGRCGDGSSGSGAATCGALSLQSAGYAPS